MSLAFPLWDWWLVFYWWLSLVHKRSKKGLDKRKQRDEEYDKELFAEDCIRTFLLGRSKWEKDEGEAINTKSLLELKREIADRKLHFKGTLWEKLNLEKGEVYNDSSGAGTLQRLGYYFN